MTTETGGHATVPGNTLTPTRKKQAVDGKRINAFLVDPDDLTVVGHDTDDGPEHPLYDPRVKMPLDEAMTLNIMALGVLEPVLARKDGNALQLIDGRRRVLHCREANKRLVKEGREPLGIPVMAPRRGNDAEHISVMISANEIRTADSFRAKAEKALRLHQEYGKTPEEIAIRFGVQPSTIKSWLAYFDLSTKVQKAVEDGKIAPAVAVKLAALPRAEQESALLDLDVASGKKVNAAKAAAKVRQVRATTAKAGAEAGASVSRKLLKGIVEANETLTDGLPSEFIAGLRFALGELSPSKIAGLTSVIRMINAAREEKGQNPIYDLE